MPKADMLCAETIRSPLYRLRMAKGLTRRQVADVANLSVQAYGKIERHQWRNIALTTAVRIARAIGVSTDVLAAAMEEACGSTSTARN